MQKLIKGIHKFQNEVFSTKSSLFKDLKKGQNPQVLFITCSDSRISPSLITQTDPGDLFVVRNAGNIVPVYGQNPGGEIASIEFALDGLGIKDVIICGHSHCGAMKGLLKPSIVENLPAMKAWLQNADSTKRIVFDHYKHLEGDALLMAAVEENVLAQIEHLKTHPSVATRLVKEEIRIHGWVYKFETGTIFKYDEQSGQFVPLVDETEMQTAEATV